MAAQPARPQAPNATSAGSKAQFGAALAAVLVALVVAWVVGFSAPRSRSVDELLAARPLLASTLAQLSLENVTVLVLTREADVADAVMADPVRASMPLLLRNTTLMDSFMVRVWTPEHVVHSVDTLKDVRRHRTPSFVYSHGPAVRQPMIGIDAVIKSHAARAETRMDMMADRFVAHALTGEPDADGWFYTWAAALSGHPTLATLREEADSLLPFTIKGPKFSLDKAYKFRTTQIWVGPSGATTHLHVDAFHNFFLQVHGSKRFLLCPPSAHSSLYMYPHLHPGALQSQVDFEPNDIAVTQVGARLASRFARFAGTVCQVTDVHAGEVLYLPPFWFHMVLTITPSVSLSVWGETEHNKRMNAVLDAPLPLENPRDGSPTLLALFARDWIAQVVEWALTTRRGVRDGWPNVRTFIADLWTERYAPLADSLGEAFVRSDTRCAYSRARLLADARVSGEHALYPLARLADDDTLAALLAVDDVRGLRAMHVGNWIERVALKAVGVELVAAFLRDLATDCSAESSAAGASNAAA